MPQPAMITKVIATLILAVLVLPSLLIIPIAFSDSAYLTFPPVGFTFRWFIALFRDPDWLAAAARSLRVGIGVMICATTLGGLSAVLVARSGLFIKRTARVLFIAPMVLPVIIYAISIYGLYARLHAVGTDWGLILAHTVLAAPFPFLMISAALQNMDKSLIKAAASSGASPFHVFRLITAPIIAPAILSGALFAFLTSFDEVVVAMFIGGPDPTLPKRMLDNIRFEYSPLLAAVAALLVCVTTVGVLLVSGKKLPLQLGVPKTRT